MGVCVGGWMGGWLHEWEEERVFSVGDAWMGGKADGWATAWTMGRWHRRPLPGFSPLRHHSPAFLSAEALSHPDLWPAPWRLGGPAGGRRPLRPDVGPREPGAAPRRAASC